MTHSWRATHTQLKRMNRSFTYHDTATLIACIQGMSSAWGEMQRKQQDGYPLVSSTTRYVAFRTLAETICHRYLLKFTPPNIISTHGGKTVVLERSANASLPKPSTILDLDMGNRR
jgi:hypothetical protein